MTANLECDASGFLRLCDASRLTEKELPLAMRRLGSRLRDAAQSEHVYNNDTSRLTNSITHMEGRDGNTYWTQIGTNVEYGPYVEYGTGRRGSDMYIARDGKVYVTEGLTFRNDWPGMGPHPYLRVALYDHVDACKETIEDAVKRSARRG